MKSVVRSGMNSRWVCVPFMKPLPVMPPEPIAIIALDDVEALAERVRGRVEQRADALLLVVVQHRPASTSAAQTAASRRRSAATAAGAEQHRRHDQLPRQAGEEDHVEAGRPAPGCAVPRSGCLTIRPTGTSSSTAGDHEVEHAQLAFALLEPPGQHQRHREAGQK